MRTLALLWCIFEFHPQVTLAVILVGGAVAVNTGALTVGGLVGFVALFTVLLWPILSLGFLFAFAQETASACDRIGELLDAPITVTDRPGVRAGRRRLPRPAAASRASASPTRARPARCSTASTSTIAPGETVALVGATGSGKTTLTALVGRLYDVTAGRVTLDGVDVRDLPLTQLRSVVATAFEDATLFSMSVRENLTLGRPDATDDDVDEALRVAQAEFVHDLPWGLDTRIGEQGLSLSGGQRQRLALARAVLGRPSVLVLDDPLSALDVHTEALVERGAARGAGRDDGAGRRPPGLDRAAGRPGGAAGRAAGSPPSARTATCWPRCPAYRDLLAQDSELAEARRERDASPGHGADGQEDWRGVATEDTDELSAGAGIFLRARSRRLLGELLRAAPAVAVGAAGDDHRAEPGVAGRAVPHRRRHRRRRPGAARRRSLAAGLDHRGDGRRRRARHRAAVRLPHLAPAGSARRCC